MVEPNTISSISLIGAAVGFSVGCIFAENIYPYDRYRFNSLEYHLGSLICLGFSVAGAMLGLAVDLFGRGFDPRMYISDFTR